jgi:serine/threonine protein kinase
VKLADFGLARMVGDRKAEMTNNVITLWYRPPGGTKHMILVILQASHYCMKSLSVLV